MHSRNFLFFSTTLFCLLGAVSTEAAPINVEFRIKAPNQGNWVGAIWDGGPADTSSPGVKWDGTGTKYNNDPGTFSISWNASTGTASFLLEVDGDSEIMTATYPDLVGFAPTSITLVGNDSTLDGNPSFASSGVPGGIGPFPISVADPSNFTLDGTFLFSQLQNKKAPNERLKGSIFFSNFQPIPEPTSLVLLASGLLGIGGSAWHRRRRRVNA